MALRGATPRSLADPEAAPRRERGYPDIGAYAVIGDGRTLALVADDGAIEWLCLPRLDSPSVFGAAIDTVRGGRFTLAPAVPFSADRRYVERTNVLETEFRTAAGVVRVQDAVNMDIGQQLRWREVARRVEGVSGAVPMEWRLEPRFDFGRREPAIDRRGEAFVLRDGELQLGFRSWDAGSASAAGASVEGRFEAREGERALLVLTASDEGPLALPAREAVERRIDATMAAWRSWVGHHGYEGQWRDAVERSLLTLNLLVDPHTGALVAAGTTSLPEVVGGKRNFDYRFGWVRDSAFAMDALMRLGMEELAHASLTWLLDAAGHTHPRLNPVYHLDGTPLKGQQQLPLAGYRGSDPVLVGNQAGSQRQLGSWGDFVETVYLYTRQGHALSPEVGERLADCADLVARIWQREDAGLWEIEDADYMTSKMSCWLVFDRVLRLADDGLAPSRHPQLWRSTRDAIRAHIDTQMWSPRKKSYLQKRGSDALDAGCLLAARRDFCDPRGERMNATIDAVRRELAADGPLLYRYSGMQEKENAFLACSFWMVEALARAHRLDEAAEMMDELVELATDVGLYSEEMEPSSKEMRGNLPQALTHLSLLNAAALFEQARGDAAG